MDEGTNIAAENLTTKTVGGLAWSYSSVAITAVLQLIYTGIMARLLEPSMFGLVAMLGFLALITVPFVYEWRRGGFEWD